MVIRLGRNGRFLACSLYPEHKESRPLPGRGGGRCRRCPGVGELPEVRRDRRRDARRQARPVRAVRRLLRYPDCDYIKKDGPPPPEPLAVRGRLPALRRGPARRRAARVGPGRVFWGCSRYPKCDFTTSHEPLGAVHDADAGPVGRKGEDAAMCLLCGVDDRRCRPPTIVPGTRGRRRAAGSGRARPARAAAGAARRVAAALRRPRQRPDRTTRRRAGGARPAAARGTEPTRRGVTGARRPRSVPRRADRPRRLRAHPRARTRPRSAPTWTGSTSARSTGGGRHGASCGPTSRSCPQGHARTSVAQRLAAIRSFYRYAARDELCAGRPVGRDRDAAPAQAAAPGPRDRARSRRSSRPSMRRGRRGAAAGTTRAAGADRRARPARPGARRDGLRGRPPDQRAGRRPRSGRSTCGGARSGSWARGARSGSGCSAGRPGRPWTAYLERGAAGRCSRRRPVAARRPAMRRPRSSSTSVGGAARRARAPLPARPVCGRRPACRSASRRTPCGTASRPTSSTAGRTCGSSRSCSATRAWRRPRSTPTSRRTRLRSAYLDAHPRARSTARSP